MSPLPLTKYGGTFCRKKALHGETSVSGQIYEGMFYMETKDQITQGGQVNG